MKTLINLTLILTMLSMMACAQKGNKEQANSIKQNNKTMSDSIIKSDEDWKKQLTPEQFDVTRKKGTERAFSNKYWDNHKQGTYYCICCGKPLFSSKTKFDSGTGWPSFFAPLDSNNVKNNVDKTYGMERVEVVCNHCGAHLGHVFDDGPEPTHLRYCMNSASMDFKEEK
ncbi:MAG: peptide-methionine (R)-S-oxide reductase MsrB [Bacteroidota bacterium]